MAQTLDTKTFQTLVNDATKDNVLDQDALVAQINNTLGDKKDSSNDAIPVPSNPPIFNINVPSSDAVKPEKLTEERVMAMSKEELTERESEVINWMVESGWDGKIT